MRFTIKQATGNFFDKKKVIDAVDRATRKIFSKFGANVRKRAQKSLEYAKGISRPGRPPHAHKTITVKKTSKSTGRVRFRSVSFLREFLFFAFEPSTKTVVIGPARLNSTVTSDALSALEYGGQSVKVERGKRKRINIQARPFMGPAAKAETPGLPAMWRDSVR